MHVGLDCVVAYCWVIPYFVAECDRCGNFFAITSLTFGWVPWLPSSTSSLSIEHANIIQYLAWRMHNQHTGKLRALKSVYCCILLLVFLRFARALAQSFGRHQNQQGGGAKL